MFIGHRGPSLGIRNSKDLGKNAIYGSGVRELSF
jgi:hypothetical protein